MRSRFSRLSLLAKILLSTTVAITILFAFTGEIVLHSINRTMADSLQQDLSASFKTYTSLVKAQSDLLSTVSLIISNTSDVRGLISTGDRATIEDAAGELWFAPSQVAVMGRVQRLRAGFGLNYAAVGLVTDLLDRIAVLEAALREARPPGR